MMPCQLVHEMGPVCMTINPKAKALMTIVQVSDPFLADGLGVVSHYIMEQLEVHGLK